MAVGARYQHYEHYAPRMYTLRVRYTINKYGKLVEPLCLTPTGFKLDNFVVNTLKECPHTWSPATQNGRPVTSWHSIILVFNIGAVQNPSIVGRTTKAAMQPE